MSAADVHVSEREPVRAETSPLPWGTHRKPRRDDEFALRVETIDERGDGVGTVDGYRVTVRGGVPGSEVLARAVRRRKDRVEARLVAVRAASPEAAEPRCPHFGTCGGCSLQGLAYPAQLRALEALVRRQLEPLVAAGGVPEVEPVLGARDPWQYRNKMDFTFSSRRWVEEHEPEGAPADFALGLHARGRHDKVLDVGGCAIQFPGGDALLAGARALAREIGLAPWDNRAHRGVLRHLVLRRAAATGEVLVLLVTSGEEPERVDRYARELGRRHPQITTLVHGVRSAVSSVAVPERERVVFGPGTIRERLAGHVYRVSAGSFFQTHTAQAEALARVVVEEARPGPEDDVFDVFCGGGALSLPLARHARSVHGFELVESAVEDARSNASANGSTNARFTAGDVARTLSAESLRERGAAAPSVVVVDPPRAGIHPRALGALRALGPRRWVYVSCHLPAAVRDLTHVVPSEYRLVRVRPIDLFPQTAHLECVLTLERVGGPSVAGAGRAAAGP